MKIKKQKKIIRLFCLGALNEVVKELSFLKSILFCLSKKYRFKLMMKALTVMYAEQRIDNELKALAFKASK